MQLSVVIPAYNESLCIGDTIRILHDALEHSPWKPYEIIVADDASSDDTATLAKNEGVVVVQAGKRNIGATRNAGAAAAQGEYLLFLDADTHIQADLLHQMKQAFEEGAIGGGVRVRWNSPSGSLAGDMGLATWNWISRKLTLPAGSFFFVKRDCFEQVNGFDEELFVSEELHLARKLKKIGTLKILDGFVYTSPRKLHQFSMKDYFKLIVLSFLIPWKVVRNRKYLDIWYVRKTQPHSNKSKGKSDG